MDSKDIKALSDMVAAESALCETALSEIGRVIVGQKYMCERILIALFTGGHILVEGVPGLAKTLAIKTAAEVIAAKFSRIQFTPDLLPADLVGTLVFNQQASQFVVRKGPVFANLVLADEINRAPAKVQSALLEAMQERQVTIGDATHPLPEPFLVMATQNPIEQEGTYPLPEAQVDRFMLKLRVTYPAKAEEKAIVNAQTAAVLPKASAGVVTLEQVKRARAVVAQVYVDEKIKDYIVDIVLATRDPAAYGLKDLADMIEYGASPRASIYLTMAARAHAFIRRRGYVTPEDIKSIGMDVLRHRVIPTYEAEAEEVTSEQIVQRIFDKIEVP
ncbi:MAG: MoxR family ATPase [Deltaproteobacteria bacterium]|nr:MoxR family ATPase [Deltaproteobacteria bacterium]